MKAEKYASTTHCAQFLIPAHQLITCMLLQNASPIVSSNKTALHC